MQEYNVKVYDNGSTEWRQNGRLHRLDGPAIECTNGYKALYQNGQRHRIDGPAVEYSDGSKEWWVNDQRHRIDGPACEYVNGYKAWYIDGKEYTEEEYHNKLSPVKELTVAEVEKLLGHRVKIVKE